MYISFLFSFLFRLDKSYFPGFIHEKTGMQYSQASLGHVTDLGKVELGPSVHVILLSAPSDF